MVKGTENINVEDWKNAISNVKKEANYWQG
jgi:hypothetical protein